MSTALRHRWEQVAGSSVPMCRRCDKAKSNLIHRLGSRCSVCFRYFPHYELDSSRRCDECRP